MNTSWTKIGLGVCALAVLGSAASAQKPSGAENTLLGIHLYDTGVKVVTLYGSPDEIQAVSLGTTDVSGGGGGFGAPGGGGFGAPGAGGGAAPGSGRGGGGGRPGVSSPGADWQSLMGLGNQFLGQGPSVATPGATVPGGTARPGRGGPGMAPPLPGVPGGGAPGGGAPGSTTTPTPTQYTRWVYNRAGSKYGFIIDNQGRVVQIEAIGMQNNRVKTKKGLGFGATFAQLIKTYGNPDGYEVAGDSILVKYLVNKKVAFRLTRLGVKKPHVVTGVVVSAGKV